MATARASGAMAVVLERSFNLVAVRCSRRWKGKWRPRGNAIVPWAARVARASIDRLTVERGAL